MAYRRRQGMTRSTTFNDHIYQPHEEEDGFKGKKDPFSSPSPSPALHRLSSPSFPSSNSKGPVVLHNSDDYKYGFWGVLANKAKSLLDDDQKPPQRCGLSQQTAPNPVALVLGQSRVDGARLRKGLGAFTSSLNHIGNALEEGRMVVDNKTPNIIQETSRLHVRTQGINDSDGTQPLALPNPETQLKASRDVAMATAAKAKLLLRELKTIKAELVFAKERCTQLEEENKQLRENRVKGDNHTDDDMIRLQLEILLAEKTRLAHENSILARENRFLREIVEYNQLTMQDLLYVDELEGGEELREASYPYNPYSMYNTPRIGNDNDSHCLSQPSSPRDLKECDEALYEEPPDDDGQVEASSEPAIHAAAAEEDRSVSRTSNHI